MRLRYGVLLLLVTGCGGGGNSYGTNPPPAPPPPPPPGPVVNVSMTDNAGLVPFAFAPPTLTIQVGTTVKWTNSGSTGHTSTSDASPPVWNSGLVRPAQTDQNCPYPPCSGTTPAETYQWSFNAPGTYAYHCELHKLQGMTGTITVNP